MMKKNGIIAVAAAAVSLGLAVSAYAGEWKHDDAGWWYQNEDGSYPSDGWQQINGKHYYFDGSGYMLADTVTPDGYRVDADGAWIEGEAQQAGGVLADGKAYDNDANRAALLAYRTELQNGSYQLANSEIAVFDINLDGIYEMYFWGNHGQRFIQYFMYYDNGVKREEYLPKFAFDGVGKGRYRISGLEAGVMTGMVYEYKDNQVSQVDSFGYLTAAYNAGNVDEQKEAQYNSQSVIYTTVKATEENINRYLGGNGESTGTHQPET